MSLQMENQDLEVNDLTLSKYGFGFKLKSFISVLGWTGMILSIIGGLSSLIPIIIPLQSWDCSSIEHNFKQLCGLMLGFGIACMAWAIIWFCLSFFLKKMNNQNDIGKVTRILKIICYVQGSLMLILSVIVIIGTNLIGFGMGIDYIIYPATSPAIILAILMIIGVAIRKPKLLIVYIIMSVVFVITFILFIIGYSIYLSFFTYNISGLPVILGLLSSIGIGLFFIYWLGFVVALQTIMKKT